MSIEEIPICGVSEIDQVIEGALFERWKAGNPTALRIQPEHVNQRVQKAVETIIANNGTYATGDNVLIHSRRPALSLATEMGYVLKQMGCNVCIIYYLGSKPEVLHKLVSSLPSRESLEKITKQYNELLEFASEKGHWVVPTATPEKTPTEEQRGSIKALSEAAVTKGLAEFDEKVEKGLIKSHDMIAFPAPHEGKRAGFSLPEWETHLYNAMAVPKEELERIIFESQYFKLLKTAYEGNRKIKLVRDGEYPVKLTMKLVHRYDRRPILKDVGAMGNVSVLGENFEAKYTNTPPGEICLSPIEISVDGYVNSEITTISRNGVPIKGLYIEFERGRVVKVKASEGLDELKILTGLLQPKNSAERRCYAFHNTFAELGIGINPYKIQQASGSMLIDEKMIEGIHIATGRSIQLGGINPGSILGLSIEHSDYLVGPVEMHLI